MKTFKLIYKKNLSVRLGCLMCSPLPSPRLIDFYVMLIPPPPPNTMCCSSIEFTEEELFIDKKARGLWVRTSDVKVIWAMPKSKNFLSESLPKL